MVLSSSAILGCALLVALDCDLVLSHHCGPAQWLVMVAFTRPHWSLGQLTALVLD